MQKCKKCKKCKKCVYRQIFRGKEIAKMQKMRSHIFPCSVYSLGFFRTGNKGSSKDKQSREKCGFLENTMQNEKHCKIQEMQKIVYS